MSTLMKCGHTAQAIDKDGNPCCVICIGNPLAEQVEENLPDLTGRLAKCGCGNTRESSISLPFFEYLGLGSYEAKNMCNCGYYRIAHYPYWQAKIEKIQRWFKIDSYKHIITNEFHAPHCLSMIIAEKWYQSVVEDMNRDYSKCSDYTKKFHEETKIKSVKFLGVKQIKNNLECNGFKPTGSQKYDRFYCGCRGWD